MRKSIITAAVLAAVVALAAFAPGIASAKSVSFSGTYKGTASVLKSGSAITIKSVKGAGKGTGGLNKISGGPGKGNKTSGSCATFGGPGVISGSAGSIKLSVSSKSLACKGSGDDITVKGTATVSGGSGKYGKAKGTLSFKGVFNEKTGAFTATISGKLSV